MNLGQFIKEKRIENGLTQEELGDLIGKTKGIISRWERGEVKNLKRSTLKSIAAALNIPIMILIDCFDNEGNLDVALYNSMIGKTSEEKRMSPEEFQGEVEEMLARVDLEDEKKQFLKQSLNIVCKDKK